MRRHPIRRRTPRRILAAIALTVLVSVWVGAGTLAVRAAWTSLHHPEREAVAATAPSRLQLDDAISGAESFIEGLYAPRDDGAMVVSEYYGLPVRARFDDGPWQLLGHDDNRIERIQTGTYGDLGRVTWRDGQRELVGRLFVDWYFSPSYAHITFTPISLTGGPTQLSLSERPLMTVTSEDVGRSLDALVPIADRNLFRSHRFTVRHATNHAEQYAAYNDQRDVSHRMGVAARHAGFPAGRDIYAAMWGASARWDDQSPFTAHAYADCSNPMKADSTTYSYRSKTCSVPDRAYVWLSSFDPLVRMLQGLHVLNRHGDPERRYADPEHTRVSVRSEVSRWEAMYRDQGGIPRCSPISCDSTWSSGIRTAVFGALETELGYRFHDPVSRTYADRAATMILASQIKPPGTLRMANGAFYRPLMVGGFMIAWRPGMLIGFSSKLAAKAVDETVSALSMPQEHVGQVVTNAESAMASYAFLVRYRCLKYHAGCSRQIPGVR